MTAGMKAAEEDKDSAYLTAVRRALTFSKIKLIRFSVLDVYNKPRCKLVPLNRIHQPPAFATIVVAGLPPSADMIVPNSGLDASGSVRVHPDWSTLRCFTNSTATVLGDYLDPATQKPSVYCTRSLLKRMLQEAQEKHHLAFTVGAEIEFAMFKNGEPLNMTTFAEPTDSCQDILNEINEEMENSEIDVECIHAESAPGQFEVVLACQTDPVVLADSVWLAREIIASTARRHNCRAIFLPKFNPLAAGSGCHVHISCRNTQTEEAQFGNPATSTTFLEPSLDHLTATGQAFTEGILTHLPALLGVTLPTVNSFSRVGKGCWTGHNVSWAFDDKEAPIRIAGDFDTLTWNRLEFKLLDSTANMYLALACIIGCGVDGVQQKLSLRAPNGTGEGLPTGVSGALDMLEKDETIVGLMGADLVKAYTTIRRLEANGPESTIREQTDDALMRAY